MKLFNNFVGYRNTRVSLVLLTLITSLVIPAFSFATEAVPGGGGHTTNISIIFLWIAVILILAKVSALVERVGQPAVLGEILMGICLGNLPLLGIYFFVPMVSNEIMHFLSELGVVILLFYIGMESSVESMAKVGVQSFLVATVGVAVPFVLGTYVAGPILMPGQSANTYLFLGSILTATSVGITARVLKDIGKSQTSESRVIIGAAVIDDIMGLVILAVVSAIVFKGSVSMAEMGIILAKAIIFLVGAVLIGMPLAPFLGKFFSKIHTGVGMIPRGEVGLIFANMGKSLGVMDDNIFSAIVVVIMLTTLITPPILATLLKDR